MEQLTYTVHTTNYAIFSSAMSKSQQFDYLRKYGAFEGQSVEIVIVGPIDAWQACGAGANEYGVIKEVPARLSDRLRGYAQDEWIAMALTGEHPPAHVTIDGSVLLEEQGKLIQEEYAHYAEQRERERAAREEMVRKDEEAQRARDERRRVKRDARQARRLAFMADYTGPGAMELPGLALVHGVESKAWQRHVDKLMLEHVQPGARWLTHDMIVRDVEYITDDVIAAGNKVIEMRQHFTDVELKILVWAHHDDELVIVFRPWEHARRAFLVVAVL